MVHSGENTTNTCFVTVPLVKVRKHLRFAGRSSEDNNIMSASFFRKKGASLILGLCD